MWQWIGWSAVGLATWSAVSVVVGVVIGRIISRADAEQRRVDQEVLGEMIAGSADLERAAGGDIPRDRPSAGGTPLGEGGWRTWRVEAR